MISNQSILHFLSPLDVAIIALSFVVFMVLPKIGLKKRAFSNKDYLVMGRGLSLPLFVATLTSTWYGGILGVTQIAFLHGIYSFVTQGLFWYISYLLFALFLVKRIRRHQVLSVPELIGLRFGMRARKYAALLLFMHALPITYALSLGIVMHMIMGIDFIMALLLGVGLVTFYTAVGGLRGVVVTDAVQFMLMFVAVIMVVGFSWYNIGGVQVLKSSLPAEYFSVSQASLMSRGVIWLFIACTTTFIHPVFYQRCLAASSDTTAQVGIGCAMLFWLIFDTCTCLGGMYARLLLPHADSTTAYVQLAMHILPHGLKGLFMAGVLATIISTLDSFLLVSGTAISYDFLSRRHTPYAHYAAIGLTGIFVMLMGLIYRGDFEASWLLMEGAFSCALLPSVLTALFTKSSLPAKNFFVPASSALVAFFSASFLNQLHNIAVEPFFIGHLCGLLGAGIMLYLHRQRNPKMALFSNA